MACDLGEVWREALLPACQRWDEAYLVAHIADRAALFEVRFGA